MSKADSLTDQLRQAIRAGKKTPYRIAKETGLAESTLSRFMSGSGLHSDSIDLLAQNLGLEMGERKKMQKQKGR